MMALIPIVQYPDPRLGMSGKKVEVFDGKLKQMVDDMFETHYNSTNCAALAATQLGLPWCITVIDFSEDKDQPLCLINPEILERSGSQTSSEGCMSVHDIYQKVTRSECVSIRYQDVDGVHHEMQADGFMAKCIQHEIDHLHGMLFLQRLTPLRKAMVSKKIAKLLRKT